MSITQALQAITHDAVIWKANRIWSAAADPDEKAVAIDEITTMLLCIGNDVKRSAYVKTFCELNKKSIKQTDLKKAC
jgi:hypothetical protein